jgi:MFS family permease
MPTPDLPRHRPEGRTADLFAAPHRGLTLGLVLSITLVAFESLAVATIMPIVTGELGGLDLYGWAFSAFFLGNLLGIIVAGGALDRMPLWRPFAAGLGLFAVGLAMAGFAPSMPILVLARFVQGLGGGVIPPTAYVAIARSLPEDLRARMFAILSTAWVVPGVIGPALAAVVGEALGWRIVFLGLLPFLALAGVLAISALSKVPGAPASEIAAAQATVRRLPNAFLLTTGAGLLLVALTLPEPLPGVLATAGVPLPVAAMVGGALGLALLVPAFRRLTPPGTLRLAPGLPAAILLRGVLTFGFFSADVYLPLLLQDWRGTAATLTGLAFTSATLTWTAGAWIQARRIQRQGPVLFIATGFAILVAAILLTLPVLFAAVPPELTIVTWGIAGLGMGFAYSALSVLVLRDAPAAQVGSASSALQLSDVLGTALGAGAGGAIVAAGTRAGPDALGVALGAAFLLAATVSIGGLIATRRLPSPPGRPVAT